MASSCSRRNITLCCRRHSTSHVGRTYPPGLSRHLLTHVARQSLRSTVLAPLAPTRAVRRAPDGALRAPHALAKPRFRYAHRVPSAPTFHRRDVPPRVRNTSAVPLVTAVTPCAPPTEYSECGLQVSVPDARDYVAPLRNRHIKAATPLHAPRAARGGRCGAHTLRPVTPPAKKGQAARQGFASSERLRRRR